MPQENVTITATTDELDAKLSKSMKDMGVHHDQYGRLINKEGQFVSGLSQSAIKMGDYIDTTGKLRNAQGQLIEGLTPIQKKMRMWVDDLGYIHNAEGEVIGQTEELRKKVEETATAGQRGFDMMLGSAKKLSKMSGNLSQIIALVGQGNSGFTTLSKGIVIATQSFSQFALAVGVITKVTRAIKLMTVATEGQAVAQVILNAVTGNWVMLAAGAAAAGTAAVAIYKSMPKAADDVKTSTVSATEAIDGMVIAWEKVRASMIGAQNASAGIAAGFTAQSVAHTESINRQIADVNRLAKEAKQANEERRKEEEKQNNDRVNRAKALNSYTRGAGTYLTFGYVDNEQEIREKEDKRWQEKATKAKEAADKLDEANKQLASAVSQMVAEDLPRDELAELKDRAKFYSEAMEAGTLSEEALANAQKALENNLKKQAEIVAKEKGWGDWIKEENFKITEPQTREELDAAIAKAAEDLGEGSELYLRATKNLKEAFDKNAAKQEEEARKKEEAEVQKAKSALGSDFDDYATGRNKIDADVKAYEEKVKTWTENFEKAGKSQEELNAAIAGLTEEFKAKQKDKFLQESGLSKYFEVDKTPEEEHQEKLKKLNELVEKEIVDKEAANEARKKIDAEYEEAKRKEIDQIEKEKNSRLSELGISSLREQQKTDFDKYKEQQDKINQAIKEGLIDSAEAVKLSAQNYKNFFDKEEKEDKEKESEPKEIKEASSISYGSQELYSLLTQNKSEDYQKRDNAQLEKNNEYSADIRDFMEKLNDNFEDYSRNVGVI